MRFLNRVVVRRPAPRSTQAHSGGREPVLASRPPSSCAMSASAWKRATASACSVPTAPARSTLVRSLVGELPLLAGARDAHPDLRIGYFAQHTVESLHEGQSAIDHFRDIAPDASTQSFRDFLGKWNFPGDRAFEPVDGFSGGERARLALALIAWAPAQAISASARRARSPPDSSHRLEGAVAGKVGGAQEITEQLGGGIRRRLAEMLDGRLHHVPRFHQCAGRSNRCAGPVARRARQPTAAPRRRVPSPGWSCRRRWDRAGRCGRPLPGRSRHRAG